MEDVSLIRQSAWGYFSISILSRVGDNSIFATPLCKTEVLFLHVVSTGWDTAGMEKTDRYAV